MLFGQFDLEILYRQAIDNRSDHALAKPERDVLFTILCLSDVRSGIAYDPATQKPATLNDVYQFTQCNRTIFNTIIEHLKALCLILVITRKNEQSVCIDEHLRSACALLQQKHQTPVLLLHRDRTKGRAASMEGYVYLIRAENGLHKIGCAKNPHARIKSFMGAIAPFEIELIHTIPSPDMRMAESYLHQKYSHRRRMGEWFQLSKGDIVEIKAITSLDLADGPQQQQLLDEVA